MAQKPFNIHAAFRGAARRVFARSPKVRQVLAAGRREVPKYNKDGSRAKKDAVQYNCEVCLSWVSSTKISVDHKDPVISTDNGWVDWNTFYERLDCPISNLQRICDDCHQKKTNKERFDRMFLKEVNDLSWINTPASSKEEKKEFAKKFTAKRLAKFPYPQDFKDAVKALRLSIGMKV